MATPSNFRQPLSHSVRSSPSSITSRDLDTRNAKPSNPPMTLARRLLFPHLPSGADLPPLLSTTSLPDELHAELYDFIALALRAFVNPWWTKITRYDKEFLVQINCIINAVARSLEARLSSTDLSPLILRDVPTLISQHYEDYRTAALKLNTSYAIGGAASLPQLFHQLQPHMAMLPDGQVNEDYVRQCMDFILKALLPPEDYRPDTERYIIREVILRVVLDIIPKLSQPWFIHKVVLDMLGPSDNDEPPNPVVKQQSITLHLIVVFILSAIQSVSGFCLTLIQGYKQALLIIKQVNNAPHPRSDMDRNVSPTGSLSEVVSKHPSRSSSLSTSATDSSVSLTAPSSSHVAEPEARWPQFEYNGDYAQPLVRLISIMFCLQGRFASAALLNIIEMMTAASSSFLDKLLPYMLHKYVLHSACLVDIIKISKITLFPNGYLAPTPVDPSPEEQAKIRGRLARKMEELVPWWLLPIILGPKTKRETIDGILEPFSSPECNTHLILLLLDAIFMSVLPELGYLTDVNLVGGYSAKQETNLKRRESVGEDVGSGNEIQHVTSSMVPSSTADSSGK